MRISRYKSRKPIFEINYRVNNQIIAPELRIIDENDESLGVMPRERALEIAEERGMDLVEVSPKAEPPVCKLINYGKFKYEKEKELKRQKAHQKKVEIKGVRLSLRIGEHDINVRKNQAIEFLNDGNKVQLEMILRGRERQYFNLADEVFKNFILEIKKEVAIRIEQPLSRQAGHLTMLVAKA